MVSAVTQVSATETLHLHVVRCDAEVFGEFIDFLFGLFESQIRAYKESEAMSSPASHSVLDQLRPEWKVTTARRTLTAKGQWHEVRGSLDLTQAALVEVSMWAPDAASISIQAGRSTAGTLRIKASPEWLDHNMPRIERQARTLTPRWGKYWRQAPFYVIGAAAASAWIASLIGLFRDPTEMWAIAGIVSSILLLLAGLAVRFPLLQLGPVPAPRWRKWVAWIASAIFAGAIGVLLTRLFDAFNPPAS